MITGLRVFYLQCAILADLAIGTLSAVALSVIITLSKAWQGVGCLLDRDGVALYGALLGSLAALLGFSVAVIAIVSGLVQTRPFKTFRVSDRYDAFWAVFTAAVREEGAATVLVLLTMFLTHVGGVRIVAFVLVAGVASAASSSLFRGGITLEKLLAVQRAFDRDRREVGAR